MHETSGRVAAIAITLLLCLVEPASLSAQVPARPVGASPQPRVIKSYRHGRWHVVDTESFQACCEDSESAARRLALAAEALRADLSAKWLSATPDGPWNPRCQIVLHGTEQSYVGAVGRGGERTVGSSLVNIGQGEITCRRIDLLGGRDGIASSALPHELTHVILRDRFTAVAMPRWADEGTAILSDSNDKQGRHQYDLDEALRAGLQFSAATILMMDEYPNAERVGAFYGQSASMAQFLVARKSPADFVSFIERASARGYDAALKEYYGIAGVVDFERQWRRSVTPAQTRLAGGR